MTARQLARAKRLASHRAETKLPAFEAAARSALDSLLQTAAHRFEQKATVFLTAAGEPPGWTPPADDELLSLDEIMSRYRGKTDPVRQAAVADFFATFGKEAVRRGIKANWEVENPIIAAHLERTGSQITNVAETTRQNVRGVIARSYREGLSVPDTASAIRDYAPSISASRAALIARTEFVGLVQGGSLAAIQIVSDATDLGYMKVWRTAPGAEYPRHEDYEGLDGQTVPLDGFFDVGGDQLAYPGDPDGEPAETCNCRCDLEYVERGQAASTASAMSAAAVDFSAGAMIALYPRTNEAEALALDGQQPAEDLHVTLLYLGSAREAMPMIELVQAVAGGVASETEALAGTVGGIAQFEDAGEGAPLVLLPDVLGLTDLGIAVREELARIGVESPSEHGFEPHLTLSYGAEPDTAQDRLGQPLHFDALSVVIGSDRFDYELQSPPQTLLSADRPRSSLPSEAAMGLIETEAEIRDLALRAQGLEGREAVLAALTAAGVSDAVEPTTTYDLSRERSLGERRFYAEIIAAGYSETRRAAWPSEAELGDHGEVLYRANDEAVFRLPDETIVYAHIEDGWFHARFAAPSRSQSAEAVDAFAQAYPPLYAEGDDSGTVPITFWTNGQWGPVSRLRRIEASSWETITGNYAGAVREELSRIVGDEFEPGKDGQLLLWQGPPGTGKTWALRALASEWSEWAEFHYITDPDAFFVSNPSYMIDVLLSDSYEELTVEGDVLTSERAGKWKVLILEDTGELLSANAKEAYGQGLSRLLNVVDGMVGQGLRVLAVVTTNDELGDMHPAATRPGRCASQIVFAPLSAAEASEWLDEAVDEGGTLAELYARRGGAEVAFEEDEPEARLAAAITRASEHLPGEPLLADAVSAQIAQPINASQLRWQAILMLEGEPTDDGRMFENVQWRDLPLSLMGLKKTTEGHQEAEVVGRIDSIWRDGNQIWGSGVFDDSEYAQEIARLVDEQMLRGISVDLAVRDWELRPRDDSVEGATGEELIDIVLGEVPMLVVGIDCSIGAATIVPFPAFANAEIALVASGTPAVWTYTHEHGMAIEEQPRVVTAAAAHLAPLVPPAEWFEDPGLSEPTPLQVTDDGRVFGHAAVWDVCHIGFEDACVLAPHSNSEYRYFHLGEIEVRVEPSDDPELGSVGQMSIPCGTVTLGTGHAALRLTRERAVEHYDDSGTGAAHVCAGEDEHGIWLAGAIAPDLPAEKLRELRGAKISGDWRNVDGNLELVAMLAVNVPGFPVPRVRVSSADGEQIAASLVAAGVADARVLEEMKKRAEVETLAEQVRDDAPFRGRAEAALATLASAHGQTVEAVSRLLKADEDAEKGRDQHELTREAIKALAAAANRPQPPTPDIHVHVPEQNLSVDVRSPDIHVDVETPELPAPQIDVHVPEQAPPQVMVAAPEVRVEVEAPKPRNIRVEEDADGTRRYISEED